MFGTKYTPSSVVIPVTHFGTLSLNELLIDKI